MTAILQPDLGILMLGRVLLIISNASLALVFHFASRQVYDLSMKSLFGLLRWLFLIGVFVPMAGLVNMIWHVGLFEPLFFFVSTFYIYFATRLWMTSQHWVKRQ